MPRRPYSSVYFSPKRGTVKVLCGFIDKTTRTLDCAIYSLSHDDVTEALIRAHRRGVKVRMIMDKVQAGGKGSDDEKLLAAGIPVLLDRHHKIFHHKIAISDHNKKGHQAVITGSFNWSANADEKNAENMLIVRLKKTVNEYASEFERLWILNSAPR